MPTTSTDNASSEGPHLRMLCPQWQGAGTSSVRELASEFPFDVARRGYAVGSAVLEAVLPPHDGTTATVPISMSDEGLDLVDGVEAKAVLVDQLARALQVIEQHGPARITTLGGGAPSVSPPSPPWRSATATTWPSCGSTLTRTSALPPASTPGGTPWPSPPSPVMATATS